MISRLSPSCAQTIPPSSKQLNLPHIIPILVLPLPRCGWLPCSVLPVPTWFPAHGMAPWSSRRTFTNFFGILRWFAVPLPEVVAFRRIGPLVWCWRRVSLFKPDAANRAWTVANRRGNGHRTTGCSLSLSRPLGYYTDRPTDRPV